MKDLLPPATAAPILSPTPPPFPPSFKITNVKIHFAVSDRPDLVRLLEAEGAERKRNFWVLRRCGRGPAGRPRRRQCRSRRTFVYTVFERRGGGGRWHVNATGISSLEEVEEAVGWFASRLLLAECPPASLDNVAGSGSLFAEGFLSQPFLDLYLICDYLRLFSDRHKQTVPSSRSGLFPGAVLRCSRGCSLVVFSNSSYLVLGGKSRHDLLEAGVRLRNITSEAASWRERESDDGGERSGGSRGGL